MDILAESRLANCLPSKDLDLVVFLCSDSITWVCHSKLNFLAAKNLVNSWNFNEFNCFNLLSIYEILSLAPLSYQTEIFPHYTFDVSLLIRHVNDSVRIIVYRLILIHWQLSYNTQLNCPGPVTEWVTKWTTNVPT